MLRIYSLIKIAINGVIIPGENTTIGRNDEAGSMSISALVNLTTNDYIELFTTNYDATILTVESMTHNLLLDGYCRQDILDPSIVDTRF